MKEKDERRTKSAKILKSKVSYLETTVENLENHPDQQEQYSNRNCIAIHGIS